MTDPSHARADRDLYRFVLSQLALPTFVLVAYFALPIYGDSRGPGLPYRIVVFVGGLVGVGALFLHQVTLSSRDAPEGTQLRWLLSAVWLTVAFFSIVYLVMARSGDAEMAGIRTKVDALYFTVTVLTSVGFGDIHAVGQIARVIVTIQMVFDVLFVAAAVAALRGSRARRRSVA
jgi:voltage-gated potassium channel